MIKYRREIDGLRALAVIPVILFHSGFELFSGGFVGVDVFFVISGYLITSIILTELKKESFSLINFYERRARRILPALFFVVLISVPFAWIFLPSTQILYFSKSLIAVSTFSSNILFWSEADYFDVLAELKPLLHTWSLAVEEQYYILFPLCLMIVWRVQKAWVLSTILIIGLVSLITAHWGAYNSPIATFYLLPTRAWELMIGSTAAIHTIESLRRIKRTPGRINANEILALVGLLLIIFAMFFYDKKTPFPSLYTLIPTIGTLLIIKYGTSSTFIGKLLGTKILVGVGLISYSAYLWHQPILVFMKFAKLDILYGDLSKAIAILVVFICSWFTWKYIENPFRDKNRFTRKSIFVYSVIISMLLILLGLYGYLNDGFKNKINSSTFHSYVRDNDELQQESWSILKTLSKDRNYYVYNNSYDNELWYDLTDNRMPILLVGNSHSKDLYNVFHFSKSIRKDYQVARYGEDIRHLVNFDHPFYSSPNYNVSEVIVIVSSFNNDDVSALSAVVNKISKDNKKIIVVKNIFKFKSYRENTLADVELWKLCHFNIESCDSNSTSLFVNKINKEYFRNFSTSTSSNHINDKIDLTANVFMTLDRMDFVCKKKNKICYAIDDEFNKYFYDYGHYTLAGADFFAKSVDSMNWFKIK